MDTEYFVVRRSELTELLQQRRALELTTYPFQMMEDYGVKLPAWARLGLSMFARGGLMGKFLELGIPLAAPFLFRKKMPFVSRLIQTIFSAKS